LAQNHIALGFILVESEGFFVPSGKGKGLKKMLIKVLLLAAFIAVTIAVGLRFRKKNTGLDMYILGGRKVGPWLTAFAYGTSYFSAVVFVGYAGQFGWRFGISAVWIGIGNALIGSMLAWFVLAKRTRTMTHRLGAATMPGFFGKRYASKPLRAGASVITFIFLVPYTASLYNGLSRLFSMAFHVDFAICIVVMAAVTAIYVVAGGYTATAVNDFIQGMIMIVGVIAVVATVLSANGGLTDSLKALAGVADETTADFPGAFASILGPLPADLLGVILLTSIGTWGLPQMTQKFYAIKSEKSVTTGVIVSTVFAIIISGSCYFIGGFGRLFAKPAQVAEEGFDAIIPLMLENLPDLLIGVVIIMVFAASISTLSSLVMVSASTFTIDFIRTMRQSKSKAREKTELIAIRALVVVFIAVSAAIAVWQYKGGLPFIAQLMGISWGALAGAFLAPYLLGLYWKGTTKAAVWTNFIFASAFMIANIFLKPYFPAFLQSPINAGAATMLLGFIIVPLVSLITRPPEKETLEEAFG
jgi:SSS family transporter